MPNRSVLENRIGEKYGYLTILELCEKEKGKERKMICQCDCGNIAEVTFGHLKSGYTKSCGCLSAKMSSERFKRHGQSHTRLHNIWQGIRNRCYNPTVKSYFRYGGRGIKVCTEWLDSFETFRDWSIDNGYSDCLTIDRINVNGNYEPGNCCWATRKAQAHNTRIRDTNTSGVAGVNYRKREKKWYARITTDGKRISLGYFDSLEEAAAARKEAELKYWDKK